MKILKKIIALILPLPLLVSCNFLNFNSNQQGQINDNFNNEEIPCFEPGSLEELSYRIKHDSCVSASEFFYGYSNPQRNSLIKNKEQNSKETTYSIEGNYAVFNLENNKSYNEQTTSFACDEMDDVFENQINWIIQCLDEFMISGNIIKYQDENNHNIIVLDEWSIVEYFVSDETILYKYCYGLGNELSDETQYSFYSSTINSNGKKEISFCDIVTYDFMTLEEAVSINNSFKGCYFLYIENEKYESAGFGAFKDSFSWESTSVYPENNKIIMERRLYENGNRFFLENATKYEDGSFLRFYNDTSIMDERINNAYSLFDKSKKLIFNEGNLINKRNGRIFYSGLQSDFEIPVSYCVFDSNSIEGINTLKIKLPTEYNPDLGMVVNSDGKKIDLLSYLSSYHYYWETDFILEADNKIVDFEDVNACVKLQDKTNCKFDFGLTTFDGYANEILLHLFEKNNLIYKGYTYEELYEFYNFYNYNRPNLDIVYNDEEDVERGNEIMSDCVSVLNDFGVDKILENKSYIEYLEE